MGKLRFAFSNATTLTVSYLGAATRSDAIGNFTVTDPSNLFTPPAGYSGPTPYLNLSDNLYNQGTSYTNQNLVQGELRTTFGNGTFLGRYYSGSTRNFVASANPIGTPLAGNYTAYGGISLGPDPNAAPTIFNGTPVAVNFGYFASQSLSLDTFRGYSAEYDVTAGANTYSVSYDHSHHDSIDSSYQDPNGPYGVFSGYSIFPGSGEQFDTLMLRGNFQIGSKLQAVVANYLESYQTRSTPDAGNTFVTNTSHIDVPRAGLTFRPNADAVVRFSLGGSLAPPYTALLATSSTPPNYNNGANGGFYTQTLANSSLKPESAFAYDLGTDIRINPIGSVATVDLYHTTIYNQFYTRSTLNGTYNNGINGTADLYENQTNNLGFSRLDGLELSLHRVVNRGVGYIVNFDFTRAYPYDIPAGFYNTSAGPNTTNLGIISNANYYANGDNGAYNSLGNLYGYGAVPYASGYGELNYTSKQGARVAVGVQYEGNNNVLNRAPYGVVTASLRIPVAKTAYLTVSGFNLTNVYPEVVPNYLGGRLTPLANGYLGWTTAGNVGPPTISAMLHVGL